VGIGRTPDGAERLLQRTIAAIEARPRLRLPTCEVIIVTFQIRRVLALSVALLAIGCGSGDPTSVSGSMHLSGTVRSLGSNDGPRTSVYQAEVKATIDRDRDGTIASDETYKASTDFDGTYSLDVPVHAGETVVVRFAIDGSVPVIRALKAAPKGRMILNATLRNLESLECTDAQCALPQGGIVLRGLPPGTRGSARIFNPVTETDAFPGNFDESKGALLVSGVFASVDLEDGAGNAVQELPAPAELRMRVPKDTWSVIRDIVPGNGQIDVPLYSFDEVKGTWVRDGTAHLEDGDGNVILPSSLASIRDGTFAGLVYAVGKVSHFSSSWNVDWAVESHGCVSGRVLDASGKTAEGATVIVKGVSYTGSMTEAVGADGRFCVEAMRSEAPGEDLDGNGKLGEKARVAVTVLAGDEVHDIGEFDMPAADGLCGGSGCLELGDVRVSFANLRTSGLCTIAGTVKNPDGGLADAALLDAWDDGVTDDEHRALCSGGGGSICKAPAFTDETGTFSITTPMLADLTVGFFMAGRIVAPGVSEGAMGMRTFTSCPKEPVVLTLDRVGFGVDFTVFLSGNEISWTQSEFGISTMTVFSLSTGLKWKISTEYGTVLSSPITYGTIPPGATQEYPPGGPPAPLFAGDEITVLSDGASLHGIPYNGEGTTPVP
jgi:hypothetical protein